jgi:hypothetical protein
VAALARVDDVEASRLLSGVDDAFALVAGRFPRREARREAARGEWFRGVRSLMAAT